MRWLLVLAIAVLGLSACAVRRVHHPRHDHPEWVVVAGHRHDDHCGHYHHKGKWYHWAGHHHGPDCGHVHRDGIWIVID